MDKRKHGKERKGIADLLEKTGTLNVVLIVVGGFFFWFNLQMLDIYRTQGSIPDSYAVAVVAATIGECGICGSITRAKIKNGQKATPDPEPADDPENKEESEASG